MPALTSLQKSPSFEVLLVSGKNMNKEGTDLVHLVIWPVSKHIPVDLASTIYLECNEHYPSHSLPYMRNRAVF